MKTQWILAILLGGLGLFTACATTNFQKHYDRGLRLMDQEKFERAQKELKEAVRLRPEDPWAHYQFGEAICERGGNSEAIGKNGESGYDEYGKAEDLFLLILKNKPNDINALYGLGLSFRGQLENDSAEITLLKLIKLKPDHVDAYFALAGMYCIDGNYEEAETLARACIRLAPKNPWGYHNLATILNLSGKSDEEEKAWRDALRLDPNDVNALMGLAECLDSKKRYPEARATWENALKHAKAKWQIERIKSRFDEPDSWER